MTKLNILKIADIETYPNLLLAPMSGVTNSSFRRLIREENPNSLGLVVTEFISIEGLTRGNIKSKKMMDFEEIERPISIQIFGHDISRMVDAAKMAEDAGADILDINSGCPVPKVVKRGGGCELMLQPEHLAKMLYEVSKSINIPLTLKIRSGWDESLINAPEIARIAEESGVKMLTVHGRTRKELYRGNADWELVSRIASERNIPVVGSGDITSFEKADSVLSGGVSGLMIGRGAMENPWIFSDIFSKFGGANLEERKISELFRVLLRYLELLKETCSDNMVLGRMKQLIAQSTKGYNFNNILGANTILSGAGLRKELCSIKECFLLEDILKRLYDNALNVELKGEQLFTRVNSDPQTEFYQSEVSYVEAREFL
jgi:nifR3 family TIM-barrel protein